MTDSPATGMTVNRCGMRSCESGAVGHGEAMPLEKQSTSPAIDVSECSCWCVCVCASRDMIVETGDSCRGDAAGCVVRAFWMSRKAEEEYGWREGRRKERKTEREEEREREEGEREEGEKEEAEREEGDKEETTHPGSVRYYWGMQGSGMRRDIVMMMALYLLATDDTPPNAVALRCRIITTVPRTIICRHLTT
jgi:hypothetical protein